MFACGLEIPCGEERAEAGYTPPLASALAARFPLPRSVNGKDTESRSLGLTVRRPGVRVGVQHPVGRSIPLKDERPSTGVLRAIDVPIDIGRPALTRAPCGRPPGAVPKAVLKADPSRSSAISTVPVIRVQVLDGKE